MRAAAICTAAAWGCGWLLLLWVQAARRAAVGAAVGAAGAGARAAGCGASGLLRLLRRPLGDIGLIKGHVQRRRIWPHDYDRNDNLPNRRSLLRLCSGRPQQAGGAVGHWQGMQCLGAPELGRVLPAAWRPEAAKPRRAPFSSCRRRRARRRASAAPRRRQRLRRHSAPATATRATTVQTTTAGGQGGGQARAFEGFGAGSRHGGPAAGACMHPTAGQPLPAPRRLLTMTRTLVLTLGVLPGCACW